MKRSISLLTCWARALLSTMATLDHDVLYVPLPNTHCQWAIGHLELQLTFPGCSS